MLAGLADHRGHPDHVISRYSGRPDAVVLSARRVLPPYSLEESEVSGETPRIHILDGVGVFETSVLKLAKICYTEMYLHVRDQSTIGRSG